MLLYVSDEEWIRCGWHVDDGAFAQKGERLWRWYLFQLRAKYNYSLEPLSFFCGTTFDIDYKKGIVVMRQTHLIEKALRDLGFDDETAAGCTAIQRQQGNSLR